MIRRETIIQTNERKKRYESRMDSEPVFIGVDYKTRRVWKGCWLWYAIWPWAPEDEQGIFAVCPWFPVMWVRRCEIEPKLLCAWINVPEKHTYWILFLRDNAKIPFVSVWQRWRTNKHWFCSAKSRLSLMIGNLFKILF